jgi:hypothetical protein
MEAVPDRELILFLLRVPNSGRKDIKVLAVMSPMPCCSVRMLYFFFRSLLLSMIFVLSFSSLIILFSINFMFCSMPFFMMFGMLEA